MSSGNEILYIKGEKNTEVKEPNVTLGDILTMECSNSSIMNRIKPLRILKIPKKEQHRYVVSVLKIIECIHREIPGLQIQNEGESDLIITYEGEKKRNAIWQGIKVHPHEIHRRSLTELPNRSVHSRHFLPQISHITPPIRKKTVRSPRRSTEKSSSYTPYPLPSTRTAARGF